MDEVYVAYQLSILSPKCVQGFLKLSQWFRYWLNLIQQNALYFDDR